MIENRIIKQGLFDWRKAKWLQVDDLKDFYKEDKERLVQSLKQHGVIRSYRLWQKSTDALWILDGCHLQAVLNEQIGLGEDVPDLLSGEWIGCKDMTEAVELIFLYAEKYTKITEDGAYKEITVHNLNLDSLTKKHKGMKSIRENYFEDVKFKDKDVNTKLFKKHKCPKCGCEF
jgi:hypothetical protein